MLHPSLYVLQLLITILSGYNQLPAFPRLTDVEGEAPAHGRLFTTFDPNNWTIEREYQLHYAPPCIACIVSFVLCDRTRAITLGAGAHTSRV